jgi:dTDP-4-amino-4,6-dideoxy-D-galactose acyltransferase
MNVPELEPLVWDSQFMGFAVARVVLPQAAPAALLPALIAQARLQGLRLLYVVLDSADQPAAAATEQVGGRLVDRKVTLQRPVAASPWPHVSRPHGVQPASEFSAGLQELAWQSGAHSRFRHDAHFAPGLFERLYSHWLRASLTGELALVVWTCSDPDGTPTGLLTLKRDDVVATIGLLAVRAGLRGQGLGQQLLQAALYSAHQWECARVCVVTQLDNVRACRFYAHCGFTPERVEHVYHLWL